jgi:hypothetical protein
MTLLQLVTTRAPAYVGFSFRFVTEVSDTLSRATSVSRIILRIDTPRRWQIASQMRRSEISVSRGYWQATWLWNVRLTSCIGASRILIGCIKGDYISRGYEIVSLMWVAGVERSGTYKGWRVVR